MDNKVYSPQVVPDTAFPQQIMSSAAIVDSSVNQTYSPATISETPTPNPIIARETINQTLNTKQRKILQEFQFTQSGAIQIGEYTPGVSGDVRLSPEGIIARDQSGQTTFALDGDTGDAVFQGTVTAGGFKVIDANGLISSEVFPTDSYSSASEIDQASGFSDTDVTNAMLSFEILRDTRVLVTFFANVAQTYLDAIRQYNVKVWVEIDGVIVGQKAILRNIGVANSSQGITLGTCLAFSETVTLGIGKHIMKMRWSGFGDDTISIFERGMSYCILGS